MKNNNHKDDNGGKESGSKMKDSTKRLLCERFRLVFERLLAEGKVKNQSAMAESLDTYNHIIKKISDGERTLTIQQILDLCELYGINPKYLLGQEAEMYASSSPKEPNIVLVPQKAQAGYALAPDSYLPAPELRFSLPNMEGDLLAFEISGESMLPHIAEGDLVVCERVERGEPLKDNSVYVVVTDTVVAKRVQPIKENGQLQRLRLLSDNPVYPPYELDLTQIRAMYRVKTKISNHHLS